MRNDFNAPVKATIILVNIMTPEVVLWKYENLQSPCKNPVAGTQTLNFHQPFELNNR